MTAIPHAEMVFTVTRPHPDVGGLATAPPSLPDMEYITNKRPCFEDMQIKQTTL